MWWGSFCAGWVSDLHKKRRKHEPPSPPLSHGPLLICWPSRCYRKALYKPVFISVVQTTFSHTNHNLELSFPWIVFLAPSFVGNYMHLYTSSVICSSLSAVCSASVENNSHRSLVPSSLTLWERVPSAPRTRCRWPGKQVTFQEQTHSCFSPFPPLTTATLTTNELDYGNRFTGAAGDFLSLSGSLGGRGRSGESKKPWKQMQPGLEVTAMCLNRIMMKVASRPKMSYFKKTLFI